MKLYQFVLSIALLFNINAYAQVPGSNSNTAFAATLGSTNGTSVESSREIQRLKARLSKLEQRNSDLQHAYQQEKQAHVKIEAKNKQLKQGLADAQKHWWNWFSWSGFFETILGLWVTFFVFAFVRKRFFS